MKIVKDSLPAEEDSSPANQITILLVDDDPDCRMLARDAIANCRVDNRVYEVSNADEALRFLQRVPPYDKAEVRWALALATNCLI